MKRPDNLKLGLRGIHHLAISVPSLERAKVFYLEVLGFTLADQISFGPDKQSDQVLELKEAQCASILVNAGNIFLEIFEFDANETLRDDRRRLSEYGYTHFALDVEDIQVAYQYLADAGVNWHHHPVDTGDGYWMASCRVGATDSARETPMSARICSSSSGTLDRTARSSSDRRTPS